MMDDLAPAIHPYERLPEEWAEVLRSRGEPRYRALQVFRWVHARGVLDPAEMTDLPKSLRQALVDDLADAGGVPEVSLLQRSDDGTRKLLLRLGDGREVETVLIPRAVEDPDGSGDGSGEDADDDQGRGAPAGPGPARAGSVEVSQCVSSQVGCAMGCVFCASGVAGLRRHLGAAEVVAQVNARHRALEADERLGHLVFMGMGEPLHNYEAVRRALVLLTHPEGLGLSPRRITVSTSGLVPQIDRLAQDFGGRVGLAISLHAPDDETRSHILPVNRKYGLRELIPALRRYPLPRRTRITIEYTLLAGVNDSPAHARALVALLRGLRVKINLIPMNPIPGSDLVAPPPAATRAFQRVLREAGLPVFLRLQRGDDIDAACGQLALSRADAEGRRRRRPSPRGRDDEAEGAGDAGTKTTVGLDPRALPVLGVEGPRG
jgi:23S rRNA (adenine2503-C2)-methyltransferase